jgi:hypothetical protein
MERFFSARSWRTFFGARGNPGLRTRSRRPAAPTPPTPPVLPQEHAPLAFSREAGKTRRTPRATRKKPLPESLEPALFARRRELKRKGLKETRALGKWPFPRILAGTSFPGCPFRTKGQQVYRAVPRVPASRVFRRGALAQTQGARGRASRAAGTRRGPSAEAIGPFRFPPVAQGFPPRDPRFPPCLATPRMTGRAAGGLYGPWQKFHERRRAPLPGGENPCGERLFHGGTLISAQPPASARQGRRPDPRLPARVPPPRRHDRPRRTR